MTFSVNSTSFLYLLQASCWLLQTKGANTKTGQKPQLLGLSARIDEVDSINLNLHLTRGITPKRVTSGGSIFACWHLDNTAPKKHRSGGEPSATLSDLTRLVIETRPPAPRENTPTQERSSTPHCYFRIICQRLPCDAHLHQFIFSEFLVLIFFIFVADLHIM